METDDRLFCNVILFSSTNTQYNIVIKEKFEIQDKKRN